MHKMAATRRIVVCCLLGIFVFRASAAPVFERPTYTGTISENAAIGTPIPGVNIRATGTEVTYVADGVCVQKDNSVRTTRTFNRRMGDSIQIPVTATDSSGEKSTAMLILTLADVNDNAPEFDLPTYKVKIPEDTPNGTNFLNVSASDFDVGENARVEFAVQNSNLFTMSTLSSSVGGRYTGLLMVNGRLDYDFLATRRYEVVVTARDFGAVSRTGTTTVTVEMVNVSDEPPVFQGINQTVKFRRNAKNNSIVTMVRASDPDGDGVTFSFVDQTNVNNMFTIDSQSGLVRLTGSLPSDDQTLVLNVVARDDGSCCSATPRPSMSTNDTLRIQIVRTYDSAPVFRSCATYEGLTIEENKPVGTSVLNVTATDSLNTNLVTYGFPDEQTNLAINSSTGEITISSLIDRERLDQILVTVQAADRGSPPLTGFCTFLIRITDVNDVDPKFDLVGEVRASVRLNAPTDTYVSCLIANDTDAGPNGQIFYEMVPGGDSNFFKVDRNDGIIRTAQPLTGVTVDQALTATVLARDGGTPSRNVTKTLRVLVVAANAALPQWNDTYSALSYNVNETTSINTKVTTFQAAAGGLKINYNLVSDSGLDNRDATGDFIIDINTGQLSTNQNLDYLRRRFYRLRVLSVTQSNPDHFVETCPTIQVLDTNNQAPEFAKRPAGSSGYFRGLAKENSTEMQIIAEVRATDRDTIWPDNKISFRIENSSQPYTPFLNITNKNNYTGQIQTTYKFDYENATDHRFLLGVIAYDGSPSTRPGMNGQANSATVSVSVIVINTNDNSPTLQVRTPVVRMREDEPLGRAIASVTAYDPDVVKDDPDQIDSLFFTIVSGNTGNYFGVRSGTNVNSYIPGEIFLLRHLDYETLNVPETVVNLKNVTLTVQVEDSDPSHLGQALITIEVLDVNDNAPQWTLAQTSFNFTEGETNMTLVQLTATDRDSGVNAQIEYRIDRSTDPDFAFSISTPNNNLMLSQPLTRDRNLKPLLRILAVDKGTPPLTSTATLTLTVRDINDHAPVVTGRYNLQVVEGENLQARQVGVVTATDADGAPNAEPFSFSCDASAPSDNACNFFSVETDANGDGGKGAGRITVKAAEPFDREQRKSYQLPVLVRDVGGLSATSWVTVTVADKNDNPHSSGNQDIYVLNYLNQFGPGPIGRVYCPDRDDWDLPDKTFLYSPPKDQTAYFSVGAYGVVTMQPHVNGSHEISVTVTDNVRGGAVSCSVKVQVSELLKEAPYRTGSARIQGLTAEDFVKPQQTGRFGSKFEAFRGLLADKMALSVEEVFIVSVNNYVPDMLDVRRQNYVDVHFSASKGEDWYSPSQVEEVVVRNLAEFEALLGQTFAMVPIKACPDVGTGCCATEFHVSTTPQVVNGNGTARVGVTVTSKARMVADERPSCDPGYCYNGGTCVEGAWDEFTCECPPGFDGPRCQRLSRQFTGQGPLLLPPLYSCIDSDLSLEFRTNQADTSLLYNGPISARDTTAGKPEDFISVALVGGRPQVRVSNGFKQEAQVNGTAALNDNQWHRLDVLRRGQLVWLVVDQCRGANASDQCRWSRVIPLQHRSLDLYTHLQVGGYFTQQGGVPYPLGIPNIAFIGCIRNLAHNGQLYDLHVVGETSSPSCSCGPDCGCPLGTKGSNCATNNTAQELTGGNSFFLWTLKPGFLPVLRQSPLSLSLAVLFRTQATDGVLLHVTSSSLYLTVRVVESRLRADYNLGGGARTLLLPGLLASSGQWLGLTVTTAGQGVALQVEGGEDRYYAASSDPQGGQTLPWGWSIDTQVVVGCQLTAAGTCASGSVLARTVIKDVRVAGAWLPLSSAESQASTAADLTNFAGLGPEQVPDDCPADRCKNEDQHVCSPDCTCKARWFSYTCGCGPGYREAGCAVGSGCILIDDPCRPNPCWNGGTCLSSGLGAICNCLAGWTGPFCLSRTDKYVDPSPAAANLGLIIGLVLGILALIILVIVIAMLLMRRKPSDEKRVLEIYPDDDIRENVISYDEEGAGEADNAAFDIARLQVGDAEAGTVPRDYGKTNTKPLGHSALPPYGDTADQPAVGDTVNRRLDDADNDPDAPPYDSTIPFNLEGGGSDAGSLSSIESASTDRSQDFDFLNDWGDKFAKLADMYGAGAGSPRSPGGDSDL